MAASVARRVRPSNMRKQFGEDAPDDETFGKHSSAPVATTSSVTAGTRVAPCDAAGGAASIDLPPRATGRKRGRRAQGRAPKSGFKRDELFVWIPEVLMDGRRKTAELQVSWTVKVESLRIEVVTRQSGYFRLMTPRVDIKTFSWLKYGGPTKAWAACRTAGLAAL